MEKLNLAKLAKLQNTNATIQSLLVIYINHAEICPITDHLCIKCEQLADDVKKIEETFGNLINEILEET